MSEIITIFISLDPDESGLGWEIHKGSVAVSHVVKKLAEPMRRIGTLTLSEESFHLNTGESLSPEEKEKILRAVKRKLLFNKEVSVSY